MNMSIELDKRIDEYKEVVTFNKKLENIKKEKENLRIWYLKLK